MGKQEYFEQFGYMSLPFQLWTIMKLRAKFIKIKVLYCKIMQKGINEQQQKAWDPEIK